jgi:capsid protein
MPVLESIRRFFGRSAPPDKSATPRPNIRARYEAAQNLAEFDRYWVNADNFDADSAHSQDVRHTLIKRARYEITNNGYSDGIAQTYATDLVGVGPSLRMQTGSTPFNQLIEREWYQWTKAAQFRRKLWCMAHAKHVDGEPIAVMRQNPGLRHQVKLELCLYEAEQCQTPFLPFFEPGAIDGMRFDRFGNPVEYDLLHEHPGKQDSLSIDLTPEKIPAAFVLHWFKLRRPGQHRGVPECASTLNLGAAARRFREANVTTAEKVATWTLFLRTQFPPETLDEVDPLSSLDLVRGMMTALPNSVEPFQLKAEHPASTYEMFHKSLVNEQARPKSMPFNKAACDSSDYNYASGRLDHQTYYAALDVEREDCNDLVLDPLFEMWFNLAVKAFGWLGGDPSAIGPAARFHLWDWPKHRVADVEAEANANETRLESGQVSLRRLYSDQGLDLEDEIAEMATTFGVDETAVRQRLFDVLLPPAAQPAASNPESVEDAVAAMLRRVQLRQEGLHAKTNGNGVHHAKT